jgi:hypothetical protein
VTYERGSAIKRKNELNDLRQNSKDKNLELNGSTMSELIGVGFTFIEHLLLNKSF